MRKALLAIFLMIVVSAEPDTKGKPSIPERDRIRLAEAFRLAKELRGSLWKDWEDAPFSVLLVTSDHEYLINHANPAGDFQSIGEDDLLNTDILYRQRTQSTDFLATFPLIWPEPTIVIGQAENTAAETSTPWVITLLHEHFHQLQMSRPGYFDGVNALNLSGGDETGMWMLNYPFPYDSMEVSKIISHLSALLHDAIIAGEPGQYFEERKKLQSILNDNDYRYLAFQLWQEGIARYTEYKVAEWAAKEYTPSRNFTGLMDYVSFQAVASRILQKNILDRLKNVDLSRDRREFFYAFGAGEALLLDVAKPGWREQYWNELRALAPAP